MCESHTNDFALDLSMVLLNHTEYDGNATKWDWVGEFGVLTDVTGFWTNAVHLRVEALGAGNRADSKLTRASSNRTPRVTAPA